MSDSNGKESILVTPTSLVKSGSITVAPLKNPRTGNLTIYAISGSEVYELLKWNDVCAVGSWFYGDSVVSNPSMAMLSPIDINFFFLSALVNSSKKTHFQSLDGILHGGGDDDNEEDNGCTAMFLSKNFGDSVDLTLYADSKNVDDEIYYKWNADKTFAWLNDKVGRLRDLLLSYNKDAVESHVLRSAVELICDYVPSDVEKLLRSKLGVDVVDDEPVSVPIFAGMAFGRSKEALADEGVVQPESKKSKLSKGQQKLLKADKSGMKSIASFFGKKSA